MITINPIGSVDSIVFIERFTRPVARLEIRKIDRVLRDKLLRVLEFGTFGLKICWTDANRPSMNTF